VGKSAFSRHLQRTYSFSPLSSGELIRGELSAHSVLGERMRALVEAGELVDDATVLALIKQRIEVLSRNDSIHGVVLDGFPRRVSQAELLDDPLSGIPPLRVVIWIHMNETLLAQRRSGRRVCPKCGRTYNLHAIHDPPYDLPARAPVSEGVCDVDGAVLLPRPDDREDIAEERMRVYHNETLPVADYYRARHLLVSIEKTRSAGSLFKRLQPAIERAIHHTPSKRQEKHHSQRKEEEDEEEEAVASP
jgi:adenylate kinase